MRDGEFNTSKFRNHSDNFGLKGACGLKAYSLPAVLTVTSIDVWGADILVGCDNGEILCENDDAV
jgi:hypothetical protein